MDSSPKAIAETTNSNMVRLAMAGWIVMLGLSLTWNWIFTERALTTIAETETAAACNKDATYRRWASMHGGVYVPPTAKSPPNPYLTYIADRDVTTVDGKKLTLINPAYMIRQVHELGEELYGLRGHITSLDPLRPENAPDEWEARALKAFETGSKEVSSIEMIDGQSYLRFMRPLTTEASCLKCHEHQGYKIGDNRGGISISTPLAPYEKVASHQRVQIAIAHALVGLLGLLGIWFSGIRLSRSARKIRETEDLLRIAGDLASLGGWRILISESRAEWSNEVAAIHEKESPFSLAVDEWYKYFLPEFQEKVKGIFAACAQNGTAIDEELPIITGSDRLVWVRIIGEAERDSSGKIVAISGACQNVTKRKLAELALNDSLEANKLQLERNQAIVEVLQFSTNDPQKFLDNALANAIALTDSKIGFIFFYDEDKKQFVLNSWSRDVMEECNVANPQTCYELDKTGFWGEAVRQRKSIILNNFQSKNPLKKGLPAGHVQLSRFLAVPVFYNEQIVALVGVANKTSDYDEADVLQLTLLMDVVWQSLETVKNRDALHKSEERFHSLFEKAPLSYQSLDESGNLIEVNEAWLDLLDYTREEVIGKWFGDFLAPEFVQAFRERFSVFKDQGKVRSELGMLTQKGKRRLIMIEGRIATDTSGRFKHTHCILQDITRQRNLEDQLRESQKMESIGILAGGVAHDFNNQLGVILGYTEMAMNSIAPEDPLHKDLKEVFDAARRSTEITRQLMAFARKQVISPEVLNLNDAVDGIVKMLGRLVGEDIRIIWHPKTQLWPVKIDPAQIDQILANLCVNSRDAIPGVGTIIIETDNVTIDESISLEYAYFVPGDFILLSVKDNGSGMNRETLTHIFEPFFTTKGVGKGTGLGLATIYGIVKQNGGFVNAESEPGKGACFKIYLPRHVAEAEPVQLNNVTDLSSKGETILLVEDEDSIRKMSKMMLERLGYIVLAARTPAEAIQLAEKNSDSVSLLMTDVVMPEMNGRDLAMRINSICPGIKNLFMSGYTSNVKVNHDILDGNLNFLQKPFSMKGLADKVRQALSHDPAT
ncbi:MAG: DUF3365 domain-containing protein [Candidatus Riflebacteria bacterium]|nr:DUF3365 domain-containing protein [Candidatus Riflebacteria bacterium]